MDGDPWWEWSCLKQSQMISTLSELTVSSDGAVMESLISAETWLLVSIKNQTRDRDITGTALVTSQLQTPTFYNALICLVLYCVPLYCIPCTSRTGVSAIKYVAQNNAYYYYYLQHCWNIFQLQNYHGVAGIWAHDYDEESDHCLYRTLYKS